jgi:hypothetical protein
LIRTARRIFEGSVYVPEKVWAGHKRTGQSAKVAA